MRRRTNGTQVVQVVGVCDCEGRAEGLRGQSWSWILRQTVRLCDYEGRVEGLPGLGQQYGGLVLSLKKH